MKKKDYYGNDLNYEDIFLNNEFGDDIVFARFINYMQLALYHRKLDYIKHQEYLLSQEKRLNNEEWSELPKGDNSDHFLFYFDKDYKKLKKSIRKLTDKQRYVIISFYFKHYSLKKIAKKLKMNVNAVYQLKSRALLSLKRYMED